MSTVELRRKIKKQVDELPVKKLKAAGKAISSLSDKIPDELEPEQRRARFRASLAKAERDIAAGRFVTLDQLRRKSKHV